ncbi:hypothetical protein B0A55_09645 [Friedmanniomyces simplex]|uniref:Uncharacterized protein n=1 Tax=Friedmanniomyces simplex TaxID=329884 RepID=A0A4U0WS51_9PEZI|nr:hypothetical protein B0A55_09645 [Friedmanniomyces simplex]
MDTWQAAQSWLLFTGVVGSLGAYYYYSQHGAGTAANPRLDRRRVEQEARGRKQTSERIDREAKKGSDGKDTIKKRKVHKKESAPVQPTPEVPVQQGGREEKEDMSNRHFAEQMAKARKGADLSAPKNKENRVKTVKQGSVMDTPGLSSGSSQAGADGDDDMSPAASPALPAGDVSDMLEPTAKGPSTLRLTAPAQPQKQKISRQAKEEEMETKKQRQNRMKKEQQRVEREGEEKARKALEEKQRRAAREARGEPAKNGVPVSKPPTNNAWTAPKGDTAPATNANGNGNTNGPLLDTFDAESTASSNGGPEPSTAATSTTEAEANDRDHDKLSEEEQVARAVQQSSDESGWTTAAPKKKKKLEEKKTQPTTTTTTGTTGTAAEASGNSTPVEPIAAAKKSAAPGASKPVVNGGAAPNGFSALNDHGDASDPASWDP